MPFKMRGFSPFTQKEEKKEKEKYPESYTEADIRFLEKQGEDVVRYEDLDEEGKAIWNCRHGGGTWDAKTKTCK